jgi:hypothetical protein
MLVAAMNAENYEKVIECVQLLLDKGCSLNSPNESWETPFYLLLKKRREIEIDAVSEFVKNVIYKFEVDFHTYRGEEIEEKMIFFLPSFLFPATDLAIDFKFLIHLLEDSDEDESVSISSKKTVKRKVKIIKIHV